MLNITTIEQSKCLLGLGLDPESADLYWLHDQEGIDIPMVIEEDDDKEEIFSHTYTIPCWSLAALLELMPNDCSISKEDNHYEAVYPIENECGSYSGNTPLEAAYSMVVWILENGYIKTDEK